MFKLNNKGFTLIEVLAVLVIVSVLGGIAVNSVISSINNSKEKSYEIMISNIVTASRQLYDEVSNSNIMDTKVYHYVSTCEGNDCNTYEEVTISNGSITVNLQTLVSNGFLDGVNNEDNPTNNNKKILLNPKTRSDMGNCSIIITKTSVTANGGGSDCPTTYKVLSDD